MLSISIWRNRGPAWGGGGRSPGLLGPQLLPVPWADFYRLKFSWAPLPCAGPPMGNLLILVSSGKSPLSPWIRLGLP